MIFQLNTKAQLLHLHCSVGLTDWDLDKELKLATTTDQFFHDDKLNDLYVVQRPSARTSRRKDDFTWYDRTSDTFVKPSLWLLVNPNIACPVKYEQSTADLRPLSHHTEEIQMPPLDPDETQCQLTMGLHMCGSDDHQEDFVSSSADCMEQKQDYKVSDTFVKPSLWLLVNPNMPDVFEEKQSRPKDNKTLKPGCWPRPPVNYCILIALALKSSHTGSLKVQQIYHFTRENFPFFQTAPDGWKNTIRHNLCFNSSFRKTCNQLCRDGKRKSCFWHLTQDGERRLKNEICTLTGEAFKQLEKSMSNPGENENLFEGLVSFTELTTD